MSHIVIHFLISARLMLYQASSFTTSRFMSFRCQGCGKNILVKIFNSASYTKCKWNFFRFISEFDNFFWSKIMNHSCMRIKDFFIFSFIRKRITHSSSNFRFQKYTGLLCQMNLRGLNRDVEVTETKNNEENGNAKVKSTNYFFSVSF